MLLLHEFSGGSKFGGRTSPRQHLLVLRKGFCGLAGQPVEVSRGSNQRFALNHAEQVIETNPNLSKRNSKVCWTLYGPQGSSG